MLNRALELGLKKPWDVVEKEHIGSWLALNPEINDILYVDDAAYSFDQAEENLNWLFEELSRKPELKKRKIVVHFLIPFMTNYAERRAQRF